MTINDLKLNEHCCKIKQAADHLEYLMREGRADELEMALGRIHHWAGEGVYRISHIPKRK